MGRFLGTFFFGIFVGIAASAVFVVQISREFYDIYQVLENFDEKGENENSGGLQ